MYKNSVKQKRSLGDLRENTNKTKPKSPDLLGKIRLEQVTIQTIANQTGGDGVTCNLAGWLNEDETGRYITIELQPRFSQRQNYNNHHKTHSLDSFFRDQEMEEAH